IGSYILGIGILVTIVNIAMHYKRGKVAGPDPWKGNTLEWFTTSPPPPNNFDAVPRVRSVEPMRDIRRQIERDTGVVQKTGGSEVNHYSDRDIGGQMERTATRPIRAGRISPRAALTFGIALAALSFTLMWTTLGLLPAALALSGFLGYVCVYTMWLKRSTPQ